MRKIYFFFGIIIGCNVLLGQVSIPGQPADILDKFDSSKLTLYPSIYETPTAHFNVLDPLLKFTYNFGYPRGYNDGPVWKGKDLTTELHGGFNGTYGRLSYTFHPVVYFAVNSAFYLPPEDVRVNNGYSYSYNITGSIDWVQRYGMDPFIVFHLGQSEIKLNWDTFSASLTTQNFSLGPSVYNPILLSRQGGGFPMLKLGIHPSNGKIQEAVGKFELNYLAGIFSESDYFDKNPDNDNLFFNALTVAVQPKFLPELTVGFNKVLYKQTRFFEVGDFISPFYIIDNGVKKGDTLSPNDTFDQMASITAEWKIKSAGFRAYAEFAKNDFNGSKFRFFLEEPEHSSAYTVGMEKRLGNKNGNDIIIIFEHTNLSRGFTYMWRATPPFYIHGVNRQGYTNNGQIIGAGIGPGGNSNHLSIRRKSKKFDVGFLFQRIEHNKDYFVARIQDQFLHDVEYTISVNVVKKVSLGLLYFELAGSKNFNKYYIEGAVNNLMLAAGFQANL